MPRIKPPKRKPLLEPCICDKGHYEIYVGKVLVSSPRTYTDAKKEARQLRKAQQSSRINIRYKSICVWADDVCKYWKNCYETKGTTFMHPWGQKMVMLLEKKREPPPKKDRELDQFPHE